MKIINRTCFSLATFAASVLGFPPFAIAADAYPTKPVRLLVGFSPGGGADIVARALGARLSERLGQPVIVDNRAGAGGEIATGIVAKSEPDGHTLMVGNSGQLGVAPSFYSNLPFSIEKDLTPISKISNASNILCLNPAVSANNVRELIALAKSKPMTSGSGEIGSPGQLAIALLNLMAGIKIVNVPYKGGGPLMIDLLGGQIQLAFANPSTAISHIKEHKLKGVAVSTIKRSRVTPELPTVAESGVPGFDANNWLGVVAPARTPRPIIDRLNTEIVAIIKSRDMSEFLAHLGLDADPGTPEEFDRYIKSETTKWARVIKEAGIKPE